MFFDEAVGKKNENKNRKAIWFEYILKDKGKVSMLEAKLKAESEYDKYRVIQDKNYISDFDREIKQITKNNGNY